MTIERKRTGPKPGDPIVRLWGKILRGARDDCWSWQGAHSKSGQRKVYYPVIVIPRGAKGGPGRLWRVSRLLLVLRDGGTECPQNPGESVFDWLERLRRYFLSLDMDAAHQCDNSMCCNPAHLEWEDHAENLKRQRLRVAARRAQEHAA